MLKVGHQLLRKIFNEFLNMQPDCPALGCPKALYACVCMSESARVHVSLLARVLVRRSMLSIGKKGEKALP